MLKRIAILLPLLMAQAPTPPVVKLSPEEVSVVQQALTELPARIPPDPSLMARVKEIKAQDLSTIDPRSLPIEGFALSRYSHSPKACELLQRIEPSAVCVR